VKNRAARACPTGGEEEAHRLSPVATPEEEGSSAGRLSRCPQSGRVGICLQRRQCSHRRRWKQVNDVNVKEERLAGKYLKKVFQEKY